MLKQKGSLSALSEPRDPFSFSHILLVFLKGEVFKKGKGEREGRGKGEGKIKNETKKL